MLNKKTILIDGNKLAEEIKDDIAKEVFEMVAKGFNKPSLAIILVGERPDSQLYVKIKEREAKLVGIETFRYNFPDNIREEELIETINFLNKDQDIDSILVQLPLPKNFNTDKIIAAIDHKKDADGFHPQHPDYIKSPLVSALKKIILNTDKKKDINACVLYNSEIFGASVLNLFKELGFKNNWGIKNSDIKKSYHLIKEADILVSAVGVPVFINGDMIKDDCLIVDVGTNKLNNKTVGDVDSDSVIGKASYLSPVPGGVGPLTVAYLFKNVLAINKNKNLS